MRAIIGHVAGLLVKPAGGDLIILKKPTIKGMLKINAFYLFSFCFKNQLG